jgi:hypothetical protein
MGFFSRSKSSGMNRPKEPWNLYSILARRAGRARAPSLKRPPEHRLPGGSNDCTSSRDPGSGEGPGPIESLLADKSQLRPTAWRRTWIPDRRPFATGPGVLATLEAASAVVAQNTVAVDLAGTKAPAGPRPRAGSTACASPSCWRRPKPGAGCAAGARRKRSSPGVTSCWSSHRTTTPERRRPACAAGWRGKRRLLPPPGSAATATASWKP